MSTLPAVVNSQGSRPQINKDRLLFPRSCSRQKWKLLVHTGAFLQVSEDNRKDEWCKIKKKTEPISKIGVAYLCVVLKGC